MEYDRAGNIIPLFNHRQKHSQPALEPETLQTIDDHMYNFMAKALWDNTWRTNPTNGASSFGFNVALNRDISTTFIYKWIKKGAQNSVLGNLWQFHFVKSWKILIAMYSLTTLLLIQSFWSSYQKWELCN